MAARQRSYRTPSAEPNAEVVELLLAHGADPKARGDWKRTALMYANTAAKVKLLLGKGAEIDAQDEYGMTPLMHAATRGDVAVVSALLDSSAGVNLTDNKGLTALLYSLDDENMAHGEEYKTLPKRRLEIAGRILLAKGVDVNAANQDGETPLMRAVRLANIDMIKALLDKKADANRSDVFGDTAVTLAYASDKAELETLLPTTSLKRQPVNVLNAFLRAAIGKKDEAKVKELLTAGADPNHEYAIGYNHKSIKRTVLILAANMGHPGIVQLLLDKGANPNAEGLIYGSESGLKYGTALEAAEESKNAEVAALLKKVRQD
jgi:ankyrin repeat protein